VQRWGGSYELKRLGGLYASRPMLALLFLISALSLAGIPPLSGFFAKLVLLRAGIESEAYGITVIALIVGLFTMFSMTKIWAEAFWKAPPEPVEYSIDEAASPAGPPGIAMMAPIVALASLTVAVGFSVEPLFQLSTRAAQQLLNPNEYISAVLGVMP
jgi:multicomponent Na+:H+ antiporter subunit D